MPARTATPGASLDAGPLSEARQVNRVIQASDWYHRNMALGAPSPRRQSTPETDRVGIKNSSGANRAKGEVLQIGDSLLDDVDKGYLWFDGDLPGSSDPEERFAILTEPIPSGKIADRAGQVSGVCYAKIDVTDAGHTRAVPADGDPILQSAETGPVEILYKPSGTGDAKDCVVKLGSTSRYGRGKITSTVIATGSTGNARRAKWNGSGYDTVGTDFQVQNGEHHHPFFQDQIVDLWHDPETGTVFAQALPTDQVTRAVAGNGMHSGASGASGAVTWMTDTNLPVYVDTTNKRLQVNLGVLAYVFGSANVTWTDPSPAVNWATYDQININVGGQTMATGQIYHDRLQPATYGGSKVERFNFGRLVNLVTGQNLQVSMTTNIASNATYTLGDTHLGVIPCGKGDFTF